MASAVHDFLLHDRFWGRTLITVDGQPVVVENKPFARPLETVKRHHPRIGTGGEHLVLIEIERKLLLGGLRPMRYRTFVDGVPVDVAHARFGAQATLLGVVGLVVVAGSVLLVAITMALQLPLTPFQATGRHAPGYRLR